MQTKTDCIKQNLVGDGRESIQFWQEHIKGATQLLKMRGLAQFKTTVGRALFRETRNQIVSRHVLRHRVQP